MNSYLVRFQAVIDFRVEIDADDEIQAEDRASTLAEEYARTVHGDRAGVSATVSLDGLAAYEVVNVERGAAPAAGEGPAISPDCQAGKHHACDGGAWDFANDEATPCTCECHRPVSESESPAAGGSADASEICPNPIRVDGPKHSWLWDGDGPQTKCAGCSEVRDALSGRVITPGRPPE